MTVSLPLSPDTEARLRQRAAAAGQELTEYLQDLIEKEVKAPLSITHAAEPFARAVEAAGVTDDEFTSLINQARDEVRAQRKQKK